MKTGQRFWKTLPLLFLFLSLAGCQSTYYSAMEQIGIHKRDIMVDRLEQTQEAQQNAQAQFQSALDQFRSVVNFDGGDIEQAYNTLNKEFQKSSQSADTVRNRISAVANVSEALFDEWEDELELYTNPSLKQTSARKLRETKTQYQRLYTNLKRSEASMEPVLNALQDQVLFLKHNLNAQAITALKSEVSKIEVDIGRLIRDMQNSIKASQELINQLSS